MGRSPDDVLGPERRVAAEENLRVRGLERDLVQHRAVPLVELDADVPFDPRTVILLPDGHQDMVAFQVDVRFAGRHVVQPPAVLVGHRFDTLEHDALQLAVVVHELLRRPVVDDGNVLVHGLFLFPVGGLHDIERRAHDHRDRLGPDALRRAAAVHRRVAAAHDDHLAGDRIDVAEGHARQPIDADGYVGVGLEAPGQVEIAAARRAGAYEIGVVSHVEHFLHARDLVVEMGVDAHVQDQVDLFLQHLCGQAECRNLAAHHAAPGGVAVEHVDFVSQRQQVARHGERRGTGAQQCDALAVFLLWHRRQVGANVALVVCGDALQPADRDRFLFGSHPTAHRLARTVAGASQDAREYVGLPVDHERLGVALLGDQADVFRHRGMRRASPLAVDHFVEVVRIPDIGDFHFEVWTQRAVSARYVPEIPKREGWLF